MKNLNKYAPARLISPNPVCRYGRKLTESAHETGGIEINRHDRTEEEKVITANSDSVTDLCATESDIVKKSVASVAYATETTGKAIDFHDDVDGAVSDSPIHAGSHDMSDLNDNDVKN